MKIYLFIIPEWGYIVGISLSATLNGIFAILCIIKMRCSRRCVGEIRSKIYLRQIANANRNIDNPYYLRRAMNEPLDVIEEGMEL